MSLTELNSIKNSKKRQGIKSLNETRFSSFEKAFFDKKDDEKEQLEVIDEEEIPKTEEKIIV